MTLFGKHTVAELQELLAVWESQIGDVNNTFSQLTPAQLTADPSLSSDWIAFAQRWQTIDNTTKNYITTRQAQSGLVPLSAMVAEDEYNAVLKALNQNYPGQYGPTDYRGLEERIQKLKAIVWTPLKVPQATDLDLKAYQSADEGIKSGQTALKNAVEANWKPIVLIGVSALGSLIVLRKLHLL